MMNISLLSDIIKYASGSLVVGCLITALGVFLLFFLIRGFYPKSTFSPLSILTGIVLAVLLAIEMVPMCGAISLKWMIDDYEHHIDSFVSEYAKNTVMPISKQESMRLFEMEQLQRFYPSYRLRPCPLLFYEGFFRSFSFSSQL